MLASVAVLPACSCYLLPLLVATCHVSPVCVCVSWLSRVLSPVGLVCLLVNGCCLPTSRDATNYNSARPPCRRAAKEVMRSYSLYMHRMLSCSPPSLSIWGVGAMCWQQGGHTVLGLAPWLLVQELREAGGVGVETNAVELECCRAGGDGDVHVHVRTHIVCVCVQTCIHTYIIFKINIQIQQLTKKDLKDRRPIDLYENEP